MKFRQGYRLCDFCGGRAIRIDKDGQSYCPIHAEEYT